MKVDSGTKFDFEPQASAGCIKLSKPKGLTPKEVAELLQDFCQRDADMAHKFIQKLEHLAMWFGNNTQYRYYASSICFFYDQDDHSKCDVRWLDFAHAHKIEQSSKPVCKYEDPYGATNESVQQAIHNLIDCLSPVIFKYGAHFPN